MIKIGVVFPQTEIGNDPGVIKAYARQAEELGYTHILAYDHVLGANPDRPGGWQGTYSSRDAFHEVFELFSFMAGVTERIEFVTGVLILPQRQTPLVAKQAASLDVLSGGRLRFGVGLGWNAVEYHGLGEDFSNRGRRIEEQIEVLNRLWTEPLVTFNGKWHTLDDVGLNPMPLQRPIPVWFGGMHDNVLRRVARWGQGWMPNCRTPEEAAPGWEKITQYTREIGREPGTIGLEPRMNYDDGDPENWNRQIEAWEELGATHLSINTMRAGFTKPQQHLDAIETFHHAVHDH